MSYWLIGQVGIALEFVGAMLGVWFAWTTRSAWIGVGPLTYRGLGGVIDGPKAEFTGQFTKQSVVFALLGIGLALQFVSNFAQRGG